MTTTPNLALTQYATTDKINWVNEYNKDMLNIDTAVKEIATSLDATNMQLAQKATQAALDTEKTERLAEIEIERQRTNQIIANPGSTSGDLALNDIRIDTDGKVWDSPADAVRGQYSVLKRDLDGLKKGILSFDGYIHGAISSTDGSVMPTGYDNRIVNRNILRFTYDISVIIADGFSCVYATYDSSGVKLTRVGGITKGIYIPKDTYFRINVYRTNEVVGEIANIDDFASRVTYYSPIDRKMIDEQILIECHKNIEEPLNAKYVYGIRKYDTPSIIMGEYTYGITSNNFISYDNDITLKVKYGFLARLYYFVNGIYTTSEIVRSNTIVPSNSIFAIAISRSTINTNEIADVVEFASAVTVSLDTIYDEKISNLEEGIEYLDSNFINGSIVVGGSIDNTLLYRASSRNIMMYERDITLHIDNAYQINFATYKYNGTILNRTTYVKETQYIPAHTRFRITVYRRTESESEIVDVNEFKKAVTIESTYEQRMQKLEVNISNHAKRKPLISIVDDDGCVEFHTYFKPIMEQYGIPITTAYICTKDADPALNGRMTWEQLEECVQSGAEVIGHGETPIELLLEPEAEVIRIKNELKKRGYETKGFAYPEGRSNETVREIMSRHYDYVFKTSDQLQNIRINYGCVPSYYINRCNLGGFYDIATGVKAGVNTASLEYMKSLVDECIAKNGWLVFMTHVYNMTTSKFGQYANIDQIQLMKDTIEYIQSRGVDIVTTKKGFEMFGNATQAGDYLGYWNTNGFAVNKLGQYDMPTANKIVW